MGFEVSKIEEIEKVCLCCGQTFKAMPYVVQDFCNRCYPVVAREVFKPENGELTIEEIREKIRNELSII